MRIKYLFTCFFLGSLILHSNFAMAQDNKIETIDSTKIKNDFSTLFIEQILFWPDDKIIQDKRIPSNHIPEDIDRLKNILRQVLAEKCNPNDKIVDANSIAIEDCNGPGDYIFLEYYLEEDLLIQVQDLGNALLVSEFPKEEIRFEEDIGNFVENRAKELLKISNEKWEKEYMLFISSLDIGKSKWGSITFDPNYPYSDLWYARLTWWSDGKNVSFLIDTSTFEPDWSKEKKENDASIRPSPRNFRKLEEEQ